MWYIYFRWAGLGGGGGGSGGKKGGSHKGGGEYKHSSGGYGDDSAGKGGDTKSYQSVKHYKYIVEKRWDIEMHILINYYPFCL